MLTGKKIVVTGSSGFIGSRLVRKLRYKDAEVRELDIKHGYDLTNWDLVKDINDFDVLYHLAARTFVPDSYKFTHNFYYTNIVSTMNMLELCRLNNAKMIFASSYVYGTPRYLPIDEKHPVYGFNPYAQSKIVCEKLCEGYHRDHAVKVLIYRQANIYGTGQNNNFLIPKIIRQAYQQLIQLNDPEPKRDFIHIDDLIDVYLKGCRYENSDFEIFNIGSGISYSIREIVELVISHFSTEIEVKYSGKRRKNEVMDSVFDITKAKKLLKWRPKTSIEDGINKMLIPRLTEQELDLLYVAAHGEIFNEASISLNPGSLSGLN